MMKYWKRVNDQGQTTTVESYSHDVAVEGAVEIDQAEYQAFLDSMPPPEPDPDTVRVREILATSPDVITQPEIWELVRIFGRRLGF